MASMAGSLVHRSSESPPGIGGNYLITASSCDLGMILHDSGLLCECSGSSIRVGS